jgi:hypothetical protein
MQFVVERVFLMNATFAKQSWNLISRLHVEAFLVRLSRYYMHAAFSNCMLPLTCSDIGCRGFKLPKFFPQSFSLLMPEYNEVTYVSKLLAVTAGKRADW